MMMTGKFRKGKISLELPMGITGVIHDSLFERQSGVIEMNLTEDFPNY